mmetsp:Transcript_12685/g.23555  ORF Transcript_12685/g.23555 Transcript_12685/m.23555 type:complete len:309 (-) Transcript_12685:201-1127(-)
MLPSQAEGFNGAGSQDTEPAHGSGEVAPMPAEMGQVICDGKVVLPSWCAAEELSKLSKLEEKIPNEVESLLQEHNLRQEYDMMVKEIATRKGMKSFWGSWDMDRLLTVISSYCKAFERKKVDLYVCEKKRSTQHAYRWLEFVDRSKAPEQYHPQYDLYLLNENSDKMKSIYGTLTFPEGVAVEYMHRTSAREKLHDRMPESVRALMETKGAMDEYNDLIQALCNTPGGKMSTWKPAQIDDVICEYKVPFRMKGVGLFACVKVEYISHGQYGGHNEYFYWLEFVDLAKLCAYSPPKYEIGAKRKECAIL